MPNGSTGTGISIIFYLMLALLMPFVFLFRVARRNCNFRCSFVIGHFMYAVMIATTILIGISYITTVTGLKGKGQWHNMMLLGGKTTVGVLTLWVAAPILVKLLMRLFPSSMGRPYKRKIPVVFIEDDSKQATD